MKNNELTDRQKHFIRKNHVRQSANQMARAIKADMEAVQAYTLTLNPAIDPRRERLFKAAALTVPLLFLLLLEALLTLFHYGGDLRLFIPMEGPMASYYQINQEVARRYFYMQETVPTPGRDLFLKEKPDNACRIFVMGGSTTAGFPYGNNLMFSRILWQRLTDAFPGRTIEMVNVAMAAVNSYTLMDFTDEIIQQRPDLVLIYAGHNEYYGALGVGSMESLGQNPDMVRGIMKLSRFRLFLWMRNIIGTVRQSVSKAVHGASEADPTSTLMARMVGKKSIPCGSDMYRGGLVQFESNLETMLTKFQKAGTAVILSELVSNIRDQKPFISEAADSCPAAMDVYVQARQFETVGHYSEAREAYQNAKDLDALRFRASEDMNALIHRLAAAYKAPVVPMKAFFEARAEYGLIGDALMTDHLHPNMDGCFIMADAFFETLRDRGLIGLWEPDRIFPSAYYQSRWPVTALDSAGAALSILYLKGGWPFKPENEPNHSLTGYHPQTPEEKLALKILKDPGMNLEKAHIELAGYYASNQQPERALAEYEALMMMVPHEMDFYQHAAETALKIRMYDRAMSILNRSLMLGETPFNTKWIGQILLMQGRTDRSVAYLGKAHQKAPEDTQVLFNLGRAFLGQGKTADAAQVYRKLKALDANAQYTTVLGQMIQKSQNQAD